MLFISFVPFLIKPIYLLLNELPGLDSCLLS